MIYAWKCLGICLALSLNLGSSFKKRVRNGYSMQLLNLVFEILCHHLGQVFAGVQSLCPSLTEKAATREAAFPEHLASGALRRGYACRPEQEQLKRNCPDSKEGKTLPLYEDVCRPPATTGRDYLQTFFELSRLGSSLNLYLLVTWLSSVSKLVKQSSSVLGIF